MWLVLSSINKKVEHRRRVHVGQAFLPAVGRAPSPAAGPPGPALPNFRLSTLADRLDKYQPPTPQKAWAFFFGGNEMTLSQAPPGRIETLNGTEIYFEVNIPGQP